jgi:hypothetical protein
MNNILKVLIGVLAISGFAVIIMPDGDPLAATDPSAQAEIPVVAPTTLPEVAPAPSEGEGEASSDEGDVIEDEDYSGFGQPMMDAAPLGGNPATQNVNPDARPQPVQAAPDTGVPVAGNPNATMAPGQIPVVQ